MGKRLRKGSRVVHPTWGAGTVLVYSKWESIVEFDECTEYGPVVEVSTGLLKAEREG